MQLSINFCCARHGPKIVWLVLKGRLLLSLILLRPLAPTNPNSKSVDARHRAQPPGSALLFFASPCRTLFAEPSLLSTFQNRHHLVARNEVS